MIEDAGRSPGQKRAAGFSEQNETISHYLVFTYLSTLAAVIVWNVWCRFVEYIRTATCRHDNTQRYFAVPDWRLSFFKKSILYAPIIHKRRNRELYLGVTNVGVLPSRLQLFFLVGYVVANLTFCLISIPFASSYTDSANQLRGRTGLLAVVNMVPLFLIVGRNNPLINLSRVPFHTFNLFHRWLGRVVFLEVTTHMMAHLAGDAYTRGWKASVQTALGMKYIAYGFLGTCAFTAIGLQSLRPIRSAFYETFKLSHIVLIVVALVGTWYHLQLKKLPQTNYLVLALFLWIADHAFRMIRVVYHNVSKEGTVAVVGLLPGGAYRVTVSMGRPWISRPGQHAYIYIPSLGFWQSHPFSVAWSEEVEDPSVAEKLATYIDESPRVRRAKISFIIRARSGFTNSLYEKVAASNGTLDVACIVEGPYGGLHDMRSYGTTILFAGGVGITHQLPYARDLVIGFANKTVATKKVILVWSMRSLDHFEWIRPWWKEIVAMDRRREVLRFMIFVTRPQPDETYTRSRTFHMSPGRLNSDSLLRILMKDRVGAVGVSACGPGELTDDVRRAVRNIQSESTIEYIEESFSW